MRKTRLRSQNCFLQMVEVHPEWRYCGKCGHACTAPDDCGCAGHHGMLSVTGGLSEDPPDGIIGMSRAGEIARETCARLGVAHVQVRAASTIVLRGALGRYAPRTKVIRLLDLPGLSHARPCKSVFVRESTLRHELAHHLNMENGGTLCSWPDACAHSASFAYWAVECGLPDEPMPPGSVNLPCHNCAAAEASPGISAWLSMERERRLRKAGAAFSAAPA